MKKGIRIYNLYPKLIGSMDKWITHFDRIEEMNFDWIYVNPLHAPGFSGSDYAVKDYYSYHPLFVTGEYDFDHLEEERGKGNQMLRQVCEEANRRKLKMMMDLVLNHTAFDSPLIKEHPEWYAKEADGSIKKPGAMDGPNWVAWGDLAQIDNAHSPDRDNLWNYWLQMLLFYADLGIRGFRCDAAYHIPSDLWRFLIPRVKEKYPDAIFLAETLGCQLHELIEVAETGFDYVSNSFKWWDFKEEWFLKQFRMSAGKYPSLTFPENHDTVRYAEEVHGKKVFAVMKYALGAYFCSSSAITVGFEYGFRRKIDVVQTNPMWWESQHYDISAEIAKINMVKSCYDILQEDNMVWMVDCSHAKLLGFTKESVDGKERILVLANPDLHSKHKAVIKNMYAILGNDHVQDISHGHKMGHVPNNLEYELVPGEVKLFYARRWETQ